jgi:hypothetical protein
VGLFDTVPEGYRVDVRSVGGDSILVEARLTYRWLDGPLDGQAFPSMLTWLGPHPSHRYVSEPCWLFRWLGDSIEARIERAKRSVTRWAEKELANERRLTRIAGQSSATE